MALSASIQTPTVTYEQPLGLFINNQFVCGVEGKTIETVNPTTEKPIVAVHEATKKDVDVAVSAARQAFEGPWRKVTPSARGCMLTKLAEFFERDIEILAAIEALDNGKAVSMAKLDIGNAAGCLRYYGGWADKIHDQTIDTNPKTLTYTRHEPIGVCGQIIPWNFPILMWAWKIGPAVATGNTVVIKTAEQTHLSGLYAAKLVVEAGFPAGVINVITGFGRTAGAAMAAHMDIDKIAFTGSTEVGRLIRQAAARSNLKNSWAASSPNIIFEDADIEKAIAWANLGIFFNHGQCCCAGSRLLVQESIHDEFVRRFKDRAAQNRLGDPFEKNTFQGPQVSQLQFDCIMGHIRSGRSEGATIAMGGERYGTEGYFIQPTIFTDVTSSMKIAREEIFGPVIVVQEFKDLEEAIQIANSTVYGLVAAVHTKNTDTAIKVSNALKAGTVWINSCNLVSYQAPFGGYKESGIGRELGSYALQNYTQVKTVQYRVGEVLFP